MIQKLRITKIFRAWKDKQGNNYKTKDGRDYERVAIQCQEHGNDWISGFGSYENKNWREGDVIEVEYEEVEKDGKLYRNFKKVDKLTQLEKRIKVLEDKVFSGNNDIVEDDLPSME